MSSWRVLPPWNRQWLGQRYPDLKHRQNKVLLLGPSAQSLLPAAAVVTATATAPTLTAGAVSMAAVVATDTWTATAPAVTPSAVSLAPLEADGNWLATPPRVTSSIQPRARTLVHHWRHRRR